MKQPKPKTLIYDIETCPLMSMHFSLGEQRLNHGAMFKGYFSKTRIICIQYRWEHEKKTKILTWGESEEDEIQMIKDFDELVKEADVVLGKNNTRFDDKHIQTYHLWYDLDGTADFSSKSEDLERHMRKHLYLPSYGLDYLSEELGLGGKNPMTFSDWKAIVYRRMQQLVPLHSGDELLELLTGKRVCDIEIEGNKALKKMFVYGMKDTTDTLKLWQYCKKHFKPKMNVATFSGKFVCTVCGSSNLAKNGTRTTGTSKVQHFHCKDHHGHAGKATIKKDGTYGKMR